jgi:hypothetical protein
MTSGGVYNAIRSARVHCRSGLGIGGQPSERLDIVDVLLPSGPTVAQVRELLVCDKHARDAHGRYQVGMLGCREAERFCKRV